LGRLEFVSSNFKHTALAHRLKRNVNFCPNDCLVKCFYYRLMRGPRWHSGWGAVLQIGRSLVRSQLVWLEFFIDIKSFRSHYGPGVDSASNRNEYHGRFLGVKAACA
jgi:hypothetical protein